MKQPKIKLNYDLIEDIEMEGVDTKDYPDFCDAFVTAATYDGREMTEAELNVLNSDSYFVYEAALNSLY